ncbi:MAG: hypothetical protein AB8I08_19070 [Sandaracinaceae bacterium]
MIESIEGVAFVERVDGVEADPSTPPDLLVEVPHGADERAQYDALASRMRGRLPDDLHEFFHANTDLGAWELGRWVAHELVRRDPHRSARLIRCLLPRTLVDTNRVLEADGLTRGLPSYIEDPQDRALLSALHARYVALAEAAVDEVGRAGGFLLLPHTYGPRTMGIEQVDESIVHALRAAWAPEAWASWPVRPDVDLINRDPDGVEHTPPGLCQALIDAYAEVALAAVEATTYSLHPASQGARFATRYSGQSLCVEVRRDLLVDRFHLLEPNWLDPTKVRRAARPMVDPIRAWLDQR